MGVHVRKAKKLLMINDTGSTAPVAFSRVSRAKAAIIVSIGGVFAAISAIASVNATAVMEAEEEIKRQILLIEDQEISSRSAQRLEGLLSPRTGVSWQRSSFAVVSNPVLMAEVSRIDRSQLPPEQLTLANLAVIEDAAFTETTDVPNYAPEAASAPKKRGQAQWHCLAEAVYFEARSETLIAQRAVAEVILNRVDSRRYPNTVCEVVNQGSERRNRCQFSYNCDGRPELIHEKSAWARAKSIAKEMVAAPVRPLTNGATHYHTASVRPFWSRSLQRTAVYGAHIFYKYGERISQR